MNHEGVCGEGWGMECYIAFQEARESYPPNVWPQLDPGKKSKSPLFKYMCVCPYTHTRNKQGKLKMNIR